MQNRKLRRLLASMRPRRIRRGEALVAYTEIARGSGASMRPRRIRRGEVVHSVAPFGRPGRFNEAPANSPGRGPSGVQNVESVTMLQ